jgi:hypothetical protein
MESAAVWLENDIQILMKASWLFSFAFAPAAIGFSGLGAPYFVWGPSLFVFRQTSPEVNRTIEGSGLLPTEEEALGYWLIIVDVCRNKGAQSTFVFIPSPRPATRVSFHAFSFNPCEQSS